MYNIYIYIYIYINIYIFSNIIFFATSLSFLKLTGAGTSLSTSNLSTLPLKLFKLVGIFLCNLSTLDFKLAMSVCFRKFLCINTSCIF